GAGRLATLGELARLLRSSPESSKELAAVLLELARATPDDEAVLLEGLRVAERMSEFATIAEAARWRLEARPTNVKLRGALVAALRRSGDFTAAAEASRAFAEDAAT